MFAPLTPRGGRRGLRHSLWSLVAGLCLLLAGKASAGVVINEILYRPGTTLPENTKAEFLELYNTGPDPADLSGWHFTKGVAYTFPAGTTLPADGYLVVAADVATFAAQYPAITNVVGGWVGQLSNSGEKIELSDATGTVIDTVEYAEEGDWAVRVGSPTTGWLWSAPASNTGCSLELINPALPRNRGQNWAASSAAKGTPGARNSKAAAASAPLITEVRHYPPVPSDTQSVTISCKLEDETPAFATGTLFWRIATTGTVGAFGTAPMTLGSDGRYSAVIPPQPSGAVIEFYVQATDGALSRTWPPPTSTGQQTSNAVYQVNNLQETGAAPYYRLTMTGQELDNHNTILAGSRSADTQVNVTLIANDPGAKGGYAIRYQCGLRIRGNSSRSYNPPPIRVNIPGDNPWGEIAAMNLNTKYPWLQVFGMRMLAACGIETSDAKAAHVCLNGVDRATNTTMAGLHAHLEPLDSNFVRRHFPTDSGGNLYHKRSSNTISGFPRDKIRWGVVNETTIRYNTAGWWVAENWDKDSNSGADDWTDLTAFVKTMNTATGATYKDQIAAKIDIEQWLRWLAVMTLLNNYETNPSNGIDDDYSIYHGEQDQRFVLIPHDLDTILGQGDTIGPATGTLLPFVTNLTGISGDDRIPQLDAFIATPEIRSRYFAIIKELLNGPFSKTQFDAFLKNHIGGWATQATQNAIITWMDQRRTYALGVADASLTVSSGLTAQNGYLRTTTSPTSLGGVLDVSDTTSVRVNGVPATINFTVGSWSAIGVALLPGINRLTVQSFDAQGNLLETRIIQIWYDTGTTTQVANPITTDTTLTAEGGPYLITGNLVIAPGATLTVQPGTNLWFNANAQITANGTLRMLGSEFAHVRCCPSPNAANVPDPLSAALPAGPPRWAGIRFVDSVSDQNLIQWTDIVRAQDSLDSNLGSVGVIRSRATLDRLTFANTHLRMVYTEDSSVVIQNSTFPDMFASGESALALGLDGTSQHIKGVGQVPAGGAFIVRGNSFGKNKGRNDVINVTSGKRPNPVVQILDNTFTGAGDDLVEVDGDALIAGNYFTSAIKDADAPDGDYASAISLLSTAGQSTAVVTRNTFFDLEHAVDMKGGSAVIFENNTVSKVRADNAGAQGVPNVGSSLNFFTATPGGSAGDGGYIRDNAFADAPRAVGNADAPNGVATRLEFTNNLATAAVAQSSISPTRPQPIISLGSGNIVGEPQFTSAATGKLSLVAGTAGTSDGRFGQEIGAGAAPGAYVSGEPPSPTNLSSASLRIGGPGIFAYRYRVNGGEWSPDVPIGTEAFSRTGSTIREATLNLTNLAPGTYTVEVIGRDFAGNWQATPIASKSWTVSATAPRVIINEVLADNRTVILGNGDHAKYVELFNPGAAAVDLSGKSISDNPAVPLKYVFPAGTQIASGGYLLLYADDLAGGGIHLGFSLNERGEGVYLYESGAAGGALIDSVTFGLQIGDYSIGRIGSSSAWKLTKPTPGSPNIAQPLGNPGAVRINEWLAASQIREKDDFLELYNPATLPVQIGGMRLSDEPYVTPAKFVIQALSFIPANGFVVFKSGSLPTTDAGILPFSLSASFEMLSLSASDGRLQHLVDFDSERSDISQGLAPDGSTTWSDMLVPTPGLANLTTGAQYTRLLALLNGLRISELMYHPAGNADLEFIELVNIGATTLDLSGVRFTEGVDYVFPAKLLTPGSHIIVAKDATLLRNTYGENLNIVGQYSGRLDNSGETVTLSLPAPYDVAIQSFQYSNTWAPLTDGGGRSLEFNKVTDPLATWNDGAAWQASAENGGTPTRLLLPEITSVLTRATILGDVFSYQIQAANNPDTFGATGLPTGLNIDTANGVISGSATAYGTFPVVISASNSSGTGTATLILNVAASGALTAFSWDSIDTSPTATYPFSTRLTAVDAQGRIVRNFVGTTNLTAPGANPVITVGTGTNTWGYPMASSYEDARTQTIYLASDINKSGRITALALYVGTKPGQTLTNWTIRMKHTPLASYAAGATFESTGWTTVYQANQTISATGWVTFTLTTPFDYDGTSNLMIDYSFDGTSFTSDGTARYTTTTNTRSLYYQTDSGFGDPQLWNATTGPTPNTQTRIPNVRLSFLAPATVVSPTVTGAFVNGEWTGTLTVTPGGSGIRITADDGAGHTGVTNSFTVIPLVKPVIDSPASAVVVAGQPFSYRITASGPASDYSAGNLPDGFYVSSSTGVISGTTTAVGTQTITVAATNSVGTGNASVVLDVQADTDGDGLPDVWETLHGLNPGAAGDASGDNDGDGASNLAEFYAGTSPRDQGSVLTITQIQGTGTNNKNLSITWRSIPGKRYRVLARSTLSSGAWIDLTPNPITATAASSSYTHINGVSGTGTFYRVEIVP